MINFDVVEVKNVHKDMNELEYEQSSDEDDTESVHESFVKQQYAPINRKVVAKKKPTEVPIKIDHLKLTKSEIPFDAKRVVDLIVSSKELVHYVKLARI